MIILPAIDIKDGNCVRLFKGDFSTVEKVAADYMETAKGFEAAGASWIHMVDLDGAKEGRPVNRHIYEDVAAKTGLKVEVGGGIRNLETIDTYLKSGVERVMQYKNSAASTLQWESMPRMAWLPQRAGWKNLTQIILRWRKK